MELWIMKMAEWAFSCKQMSPIVVMEAQLLVVSSYILRLKNESIYHSCALV